MAYKFQVSEKPSQAITRVSKERIRDAIKQLKLYPDKNPEGLHETRRNIKRLRALLRLVRTAKASCKRKTINVELRDIGRHLAGPRDHEVLAQMMRSWINKNPPIEDSVLIGSLKQLYQYFGKLSGPEGSWRVLQKGPIEERFLAVQSSIETMPMQRIGWAHILVSAQHCGQRLDKAYDAYLHQPSGSTLHEWRKRLKDHMYQLQLLSNVAKVRPGHLRRVKRLEACLGLARDHDLLLETLRERTNTGLGIRALGSVIVHAEQEKERILIEALGLGTKVSSQIRNRPLDKKA